MKDKGLLDAETHDFLKNLPGINRTTVALPKPLCTDHEMFVYEMLYYYRNFTINFKEYTEGVKKWRQDYRFQHQHKRSMSSWRCHSKTPSI